MFDHEEKEFPQNKIAYAPSRELNVHQGEDLECLHETKTLINESKVINPTENIFANIDYSNLMHKPFKHIEPLSHLTKVPNFIYMPELIEKNEF